MSIVAILYKPSEVIFLMTMSSFKLTYKRLKFVFTSSHGSVIAKITIKYNYVNSDQIVRLFAQEAELYVIQANGNFDGNLITHVAQTARAQGRSLLYCLIDGRDE